MSAPASEHATTSYDSYERRYNISDGKEDEEEEELAQAERT